MNYGIMKLRQLKQQITSVKSQIVRLERKLESK